MADYTKLNEGDLIALMQQDKLGAFREIYTRYWKKLYSESYKRLKNKGLAEEVVQELFTALWHKRAIIKVTSSLSGYLFSSATNLIIDHYRKEAVRTRYKEAFKLAYSEADNSTEDTIMLRDLTSTIDAEVSQLPNKCRSVYELSRIEHKTNKEIATSLGISEKTVETHLTKALKKLRVSLYQYLFLLLLVIVKLF
jgi:RNA polymerase sigma-70 factor (family 1)